MKSLGGGGVLEELATWHESLARLKAHESGGALPTGEDGLVSGYFMAAADLWHFLKMLENILSNGLPTDAKSIKEQFAGARVRVDPKLIHVLVVLSEHAQHANE